MSLAYLHNSTVSSSVLRLSRLTLIPFAVEVNVSIKRINQSGSQKGTYAVLASGRVDET